MSFKVVAALVLGCTLLSAAATGIVLWWLRRREILDHRMSGRRTICRRRAAAGLAVVPVVAIAWTIITVLGMAPWQTLAPVGGAVGLAYIGWRDDRGGLSIVLSAGGAICCRRGGPWSASRGPDMCSRGCCRLGRI